MMIFDEYSFWEHFEIRYKDQGKTYRNMEKDGDIFTAFKRVVSEQKYLNLIVFYNDEFYVPPVVTFLKIESEILKANNIIETQLFHIFNAKCDYETDDDRKERYANNKRLGALFGCLFYEEFKYPRYEGKKKNSKKKKNRSRKIDLSPIKSATYFVK